MMSRIPYGCIVGQCMTMPSTLRAKDWQRSLGVVPDISKWWGRMRMNLSWIWGRVILRIQELHIILLTKWFCSFFSRPKHFLRLAGQVQRRRPCWLWHCRWKNYEDLTSDWCCNFLLWRTKQFVFDSKTVPRWWFLQPYLEIFGEDFQFDSYFSDGLKSPTRCCSTTFLWLVEELFVHDLDPARTLSTSEIDALLESKVCDSLMVSPTRPRGTSWFQRFLHGTFAVGDLSFHILSVPVLGLHHPLTSMFHWHVFFSIQFVKCLWDTPTWP